MTQELSNLITNKEARIAVVGLGYVGLPLSVEFAKAGFKVVGVDNFQDKINMLMRGESYIADVLSEDLKNVVEEKKLIGSYSFENISEADVIVICVPTPLDNHKDPDVSYIKDACKTISPKLKKGCLVILESTTFPGTTEEVVQPLLEEHGLRAGKDFYLAFSPERVDPGNKNYNTKNTPKVVGGINKESTDLAALVYSSFNESVHKVSSPRVAEMEKLLENIFRIVNVSLVNEMALLANRMDIDIWEVIEAAATKPYGFMPFYPGPGAGGHCIPLDPFYLSWKAKEYNFNAKFIELAGEINDMMPHYILVKALNVLNRRQKSLNGSKILVLGVAYKKDISDDRESPILKIIELLRHKGAEVIYNDPYVKKITVANGKVEDLYSQELTGELLRDVDLVLIGTDHSFYDYDKIPKEAQLVVDTRNAIKSREFKNVYRL